MKSIFVVVGAAILAAAGFLGGIAYRAQQVQASIHPGAPKERRSLYYVDPMHPAYKSDKPGIARDCGMKREPVYEDHAAEDMAGAGDSNRRAARRKLIRVE